MLRTLVVLLTALGLALSGAAPASASQGAYGHAGRWVTDDAGRAAVFNGWNIVNKLPPYTPEAIGFGADDVEFLREQGFNSVRLGIIWKGLEPTPGSYDEAYLGSIERTYDLLAANGIAVLLDFHQDLFNERFQGEGFPAWAVLGDAKTIASQPKIGFPGNYGVNFALSRAFDHFWANERGPDGRPLWDAYAQAWQHVVQRFKGKPQLLGYNLLNEPFPGTQAYTCIKRAYGCPNFDRLRLAAFHRLVIGALRRVDSVGIAWYAPLLTFDFGIQTHQGDLGDEHAGFAYNAYCQNTPANLAVGLLVPFFLNRSCRAMADLVNGQGVEQADRFGDAVLNTEWGASDDLALLETDAQSLERHMVSWEQWAYWNRDPSGAKPIEGLIRDISKPPTGDNVKRGKLAVSARPRPIAVAGTPISWSFQPQTKHFAFSYATTKPGQVTGHFPAGSETTIAIPPAQFPADYGVTVSGARVTSPAGARVLRIVSCEGATEAHVTIDPGTTSPAARGCVPKT